MDQIFTFFNQGWVGTLIGVVGIPVSAIVGYLIARYVRHKPKLVYQMNSLELLGEKESELPSDVTIFYQDQEVKRLKKTTIIFWNSGTAEFDGQNIVKSDPIRIEFSDGDNVLSYEVIKATTPSNEFKISISGKRNIINIQFDYLNPKDGAKIVILHDSDFFFPNIKGSLKGSAEGVLNFGLLLSKEIKRRSFFKLSTMMFFCIDFVLFYKLFILGYIHEYEDKMILGFLRLDFIVTFYVFGSFFFGIYFIARDFFFNNKKAPRELK
uniref:Uncharacterized protein n=1 Tax=Marinomonas sp. (strain MWYL1) TaxID=400668 RepID=A6VSV1_MARMS